MDPIRFGIIGGGWRAEFFVRVAHALPQRFSLSRVLVRDAFKARAFAQRCRVATCGTLDELLADPSIQFVVAAVPCKAHPELLGELAQRQVPVLCETPPARNLPEMERVWALRQSGLRIQVAEQLQARRLDRQLLVPVRVGVRPQHATLDVISLLIADPVRSRGVLTPGAEEVPPALVLSNRAVRLTPLTLRYQR